ncbi:hypothetical protein CEXT_663501 [Caerostris extrusa]|uniref:Uncharacterized protein n=1 Tax=Caerostris extrusa TaxID=172846 RepID=A0AAV4YCY1_CAEEX|nr:hypothetical protein CEXT_663501 [Caerostris extrusa]
MEIYGQKGWMEGRMDEWWMDRRMDEWTDGRIDGWVDKRKGVDRWTERWTEEWMGGHTSYAASLPGLSMQFTGIRSTQTVLATVVNILKVGNLSTKKRHINPVTFLSASGREPLLSSCLSVLSVEQ